MAGAGLSRRSFLAVTLYGAAGSAAMARMMSGEVPWTAGMADSPNPYVEYRFLTEAERQSVDAIVARLIPRDDMGPGALDAHVTDFIDSQLAGFYGRGERWYMQGPFEPGTDEQGYQSELAPAELYRAGLEALDRHCRATFDGRGFAGLAPHEQDAVLTGLEKGDIAFEGASATAFFKLIHENTIEGFFCDPIYGGNRDMVGWRLVGFPGARYDYRDHLDHNGAPIQLEPVGLKGRSAWTPA